MKKFNKTEQAVFRARHPKKPVKMWQVKTAAGIQFESLYKGLCMWFCDQHGISKDKIKAI